MKLREAAEIVRKGVVDTFAYYAFPPTHWRQIRTNNPWSESFVRFADERG